MQGEHVLLMVLPVVVTITYYRHKDRASRPKLTRRQRWRRLVARVGPINRNIPS
jgi:hypothetical protein